MEIFIRASQQEPGKDGIRRSRAIIVRNTLSQIKSTCLVTFQQIFRPIMKYKVSDSTIQLRVDDIECDILLLPLDTPENIDRLLSLELTFAWISEFREIPVDIVESVLSRVGRFPSVAFGGPTWHGIFMETNSFTEDSGWYRLLEEELPGNWDYFVQPDAMSNAAENKENLAPRYYEDLMESNTPEWVDQYVHNKIGPSLSGQAVYKNSFSSDFHLVDKEIKPVPGYPLLVGMDFARHPAAVICQLDNLGRLLILAEAEQENCGVERFSQEHLLPLLNEERFAGFTSIVVGDPAGIAKGQIGEESVFGAMKRMGFSAVPASTNLISPRLRAVEKFLVQQRNGGPALLINKEQTPLLLQGFQSRYRYKLKRDGAQEDKPDKTRPWADLHDALQYACLGTAQNLLGRIMSRRNQKPAPEPGVAGWT